MGIHLCQKLHESAEKKETNQEKIEKKSGEKSGGKNPGEKSGRKMRGKNPGEKSGAPRKKGRRKIREKNPGEKFASLVLRVLVHANFFRKIFPAFFPGRFGGPGQNFPANFSRNFFPQIFPAIFFRKFFPGYSASQPAVWLAGSTTGCWLPGRMLAARPDAGRFLNNIKTTSGWELVGAILGNALKGTREILQLLEKSGLGNI